MNKIKYFSICVLLVILIMPLSAQNAGSSAGGHRAKVTSLAHNGDTVISAGEDGFIVIWNTNTQSAIDRLQLTSGRISAMVKHPLNDEICVAESLGPDQYRLSAWDYALKVKLFSLTSTQPVTYINYSAGGSFIIAAGLNGAPLTLLNSGTGSVNSAPVIPSGNVSAAMTGRAERNMLFYHSSQENSEGYIMYYDFTSASITGRFRVPFSLSSPVIFGNGRFLAGINSSGSLLVIDAASGTEYDSYRNINRNAMLCSAEEGFYCLNNEGMYLVLYKFAINSYGNLAVLDRTSISQYAAGTVSSIAFNKSPAMANTEGRLFLLGENGNIINFSYNFQTRVREIAFANRSIAVMLENSEIFFLPGDYRQINHYESLSMKVKNGYTKITALPASSPYDDGTNRFIIWQSAGTQYIPQIVYSGNVYDDIRLDFITSRIPIRSISVTHNRILVLDMAGNITVYNNDNSSVEFTFSSIGAIDAVLVNNDYFILCRSVMSGNSPFLLVNYKTGETVPVSLRAEAGIMAYVGRTGNIYAAAVERNNYGVKTLVLNIAAASSSTSTDIIIEEYPGEAFHLTMAESSRFFAIANSDAGSSIYGEEILQLERSGGFPEKLLGSDNYFISLDSEGSICWHDNTTGKLLATFKLYGNMWTLKSDTEISGYIRRN
ncbi:MAG: hypothetical protein FWC03_04700 [Treponema sp.]|nr:hypothetical protein [Treponema sp.]